MNALKPAFSDRSAFAPSEGYRLLPFRFNRIGERYIATNDVGEYVFLAPCELTDLVNHRLPPSLPVYRELQSRHFILEDTSRVAVDLLALKYRSRVARVAEFTALHMFVVTLRCDHSCHYCQVSRQTEDRANFDMSREHAEQAVRMVFRSPARRLKIEFQGGEPLLNFDLIRHIVEYATLLNRHARRDLAFVIASNLSRLTDEILDFCREHRVALSTSLDGPQDLHDKQRPLRGGSSHAAVLVGIGRARRALGNDAVSALMTTTPGAIERVDEIIEEYARTGFHSIFLRALSPYGFAARSLVRRYDTDAWVAFYKRGLRRVLEMNRAGFPMREECTAILLQKIFSPTGTGYIDLQSPAGIGIAGIVYNYDGSVYASDEGRMLAEMGETQFMLGHLDRNSYEEMMTGEQLLAPLDATVLESAPRCSECAFLPYCGADPVFHQATMGDWLGHKAFSSFCAKQTAVLEHLFELLETDPGARETMLGWL